jgi:hypothetical protein
VLASPDLGVASGADSLSIITIAPFALAFALGDRARMAALSL